MSALYYCMRLAVLLLHLHARRIYSQILWAPIDVWKYRCRSISSTSIHGDYENIGFQLSRSLTPPLGSHL